MSSTVSWDDILTLNEVPITVVTVSSNWFFQLRSIVSTDPILSLRPLDSGIPSSFLATSPITSLASSNLPAVILPSTFDAFRRREYRRLFSLFYDFFVFWALCKIYSGLNFQLRDSAKAAVRHLVYFCMTSAARDVTGLPIQRRQQHQQQACKG